MTYRPSPRLAALLRLGAAMAIVLSLNGCAALAVSLAGAGAGAGLSHQVNGTASRTFSEPIEKVDDAVRLAAKSMLLNIEDVSSLDNGILTKAKVAELNITVKMETLSPRLTRVSVTARKDILRVDGATANEVVAQIERAIGELNTTAARTNTPNAVSGARYAPQDSPRKTVRRKNDI
ncbi:MAG: DUF3568 family protein [Rhodocyclaceae bacterium]